MSLAPPTITCLFFNDPSLPAFLRAPAGRDLVGDLLVECSLYPSLGYVLNLETPTNYPGVAGLLGGVDIGTLAHPSDALPAPILLAAGSPVSIAAVRSALARLTQADERLRAITLLVPVSDARALGAALALADRFALAWDATAFPHEELLDFANWLAAEKFPLSGLHAYTTGAPVSGHAQRLSALLAPLGARLVALTA